MSRKFEDVIAEIDQLKQTAEENAANSEHDLEQAATALKDAQAAFEGAQTQYIKDSTSLNKRQGLTKKVERFLGKASKKLKSKQNNMFPTPLHFLGGITATAAPGMAMITVLASISGTLPLAIVVPTVAAGVALATDTFLNDLKITTRLLSPKYVKYKHNGEKVVTTFEGRRLLKNYKSLKAEAKKSFAKDPDAEKVVKKALDKIFSQYSDYTQTTPVAEWKERNRRRKTKAALSA